MTHTVVIVEYTGVLTVKPIESALVAQIATTGVRKRGWTRRSAREAGSPPSRANAKVIREADVTVARPQRYCAAAMPAYRSRATVLGTTAPVIETNALAPCAAAASGFGATTTTAASMTHPNTPETST